MVFSRKRKDNRSPTFVLDDSPKRTKVQAQRKFAQGSNVNSPVLTPVKEIDCEDKVIPEPIELLPMKRPNTEDFLTFLCFRGTPVLPQNLNFFNNVSMVDSRPPLHESPSTSPKNGVIFPTAISKCQGERPFIAFGVRKRADPIVVSRHMDKKRRHALALQALRRKYQEQKMAKIRAITISKLSEKVHTNKTVVRTTRSVTKSDHTITKKNIGQKTKITVVATKHVKVTTRRTSTLKPTVRSKGGKPKMCLRSYRGRFVQRELVNKPVKKRALSNLMGKDKEDGSTEEEEFSSDDDEPLLRKVDKVPKIIKKGKKPSEITYRLTRSNQILTRRIPPQSRLVVRAQNSLKSPPNSPRLRSQLKRKIKVIQQEVKLPLKKHIITKKVDIKRKVLRGHVRDIEKRSCVKSNDMYNKRKDNIAPLKRVTEPEEKRSTRDSEKKKTEIETKIVRKIETTTRIADVTAKKSDEQLVRKVENNKMTKVTKLAKKIEEKDKSTKQIKNNEDKNKQQKIEDKNKQQKSEDKNSKQLKVNDDKGRKPVKVNEDKNIKQTKSNANNAGKLQKLPGIKQRNADSLGLKKPDDDEIEETNQKNFKNKPIKKVNKMIKGKVGKKLDDEPVDSENKTEIPGSKCVKNLDEEHDETKKKNMKPLDNKEKEDKVDTANKNLKTKSKLVKQQENKVQTTKKIIKSKVELSEVQQEDNVTKKNEKSGKKSQLDNKAKVEKCVNVKKVESVSLNVDDKKIKKVVKVGNKTEEVNLQEEHEEEVIEQKTKKNVKLLKNANKFKVKSLGSNETRLKNKPNPKLKTKELKKSDMKTGSDVKVNQKDLSTEEGNDVIINTFSLNKEDGTSDAQLKSVGKKSKKSEIKTKNLMKTEEIKSEQLQDKSDEEVILHLKTKSSDDSIQHKKSIQDSTKLEKPQDLFPQEKFNEDLIEVKKPIENSLQHNKLLDEYQESNTDLSNREKCNKDSIYNQEFIKEKKVLVSQKQVKSIEDAIHQKKFMEDSLHHNISNEDTIPLMKSDALELHLKVDNLKLSDPEQKSVVEPTTLKKSNDSLQKECNKKGISNEDLLQQEEPTEPIVLPQNKSDDDSVLPKKSDGIKQKKRGNQSKQHQTVQNDEHMFLKISNEDLLLQKFNEDMLMWKKSIEDQSVQRVLDQDMLLQTNKDTDENMSLQKKSVTDEFLQKISDERTLPSDEVVLLKKSDEDLLLQKKYEDQLLHKIFDEDNLLQKRPIEDKLLMKVSDDKLLQSISNENMLLQKKSSEDKLGQKTYDYDMLLQKTCDKDMLLQKKYEDQFIHEIFDEDKLTQKKLNDDVLKSNQNLLVIKKTNEDLLLQKTPQIFSDTILLKKEANNLIEMDNQQKSVRDVSIQKKMNEDILLQLQISEDALRQKNFIEEVLLQMRINEGLMLQKKASEDALLQKRTEDALMHKKMNEDELQKKLNEDALLQTTLNKDVLISKTSIPDESGHKTSIEIILAQKTSIHDVLEQQASIEDVIGHRTSVEEILRQETVISIEDMKLRGDVLAQTVSNEDLILSSQSDDTKLERDASSIKQYIDLNLIKYEPNEKKIRSASIMKQNEYFKKCHEDMTIGEVLKGDGESVSKIYADGMQVMNANEEMLLMKLDKVSKETKQNVEVTHPEKNAGENVILKKGKKTYTNRKLKKKGDELQPKMELQLLNLADVNQLRTTPKDATLEYIKKNNLQLIKAGDVKYVCAEDNIVINENLLVKKVDVALKHNAVEEVTLKKQLKVSDNVVLKEASCNDVIRRNTNDVPLVAHFESIVIKKADNFILKEASLRDVIIKKNCESMKVDELTLKEVDLQDVIINAKLDENLLLKRKLKQPEANTIPEETNHISEAKIKDLIPMKKFVNATKKIKQTEETTICRAAEPDKKIKKHCLASRDEPKIRINEAEANKQLQEIITEMARELAAKDALIRMIKPNSSPPKTDQKLQSSGPDSKKKNSLKKVSTGNLKKTAKVVELKESPKLPQRPSRKTKEAAAVYMEILGHKLGNDDYGDDDISIDSFPELPNVRKMEQRENELKAKAFIEKSEGSPLKPVKKRERKLPRNSGGKSVRNCSSDSDESFTAEIKIPPEKRLRQTRNTSPKLYKSFTDTDSESDLIPIKKPVAKRKSDNVSSDTDKGKKKTKMAEEESFDESDEEPLVKLTQKSSEKIVQPEEVPASKQKRECTKKPQNYVPLFSSSDDEEKYFHGFVKCESPPKPQIMNMDPPIDLLSTKDVGRRYGKEKVNMSNEQIEKWLNDSALAGMSVIKKENDEMLKFGEKIPTETSLDTLTDINMDGLKTTVLKPEVQEKKQPCSTSTTPEKYGPSLMKPFLNERKTIFRKEKTKPSRNINAFSVCNESSVYAFEADNEDSVNTPFRRPSRRPSSTATSRSEDELARFDADPKTTGKFRHPNLLRSDSKPGNKLDVSLTISTDESNNSGSIVAQKSVPTIGAKVVVDKPKLITQIAQDKPLAASSPMCPPTHTTMQKSKLENRSIRSCSKSIDRTSEASEEFKYKVPSSPSASSSSSAKLYKRNAKVKAKGLENYTPVNVTEFPTHSQNARIVEAPVFHPNEKEFVDPIEYIEKIRAKAEKFGICRIVPPPNFKPECKVLDEMRFTAYNQYVHKMMHRWGPNFRELVAIRKYLATQSISLKHPPWIGGMEIDLPRLYQTVQTLGGLKDVIEKKKWSKVSELMKIPKSAQDRVTKLDDIYCKYLLPYDTLSPDERDKLFDSVETEWAKRESKNLLKVQQQNTEDEKKSEDEEMESDDEEESDIECIMKGRSMALSTFYRIARNSMATWFKSPEPDAQEVEEEFWKHVTTKKYHICVHSGSIDSGNWGYGFAVSKNSPFARHAWNLKVMTNNSGSVLRSMGPLMGLTVPTLHVGMVFSGCCWYRDPHGLPWIEYLHTGANKIWYGIPDTMSEKFHTTLLKLVPNYCLNKSIWLPSDTVMLPPELLVDNGVSLTRTVQKPGQFIVIFPKAFTSNICTGYVVSESVFFAPPHWLDSAEYVFEELRNSCEPSMFSYERLLLSVANDSRSDVNVLKQIVPAVDKLCIREKKQREELKALGVTNEERLPIPDNKKKKKMHDFETEYACEDCRWNLFCSMVFDSQENGIYCLEHAINHLRGKILESDKCRLMYTYDSAELDVLAGNLRLTIEAKLLRKSSSKYYSLPTLLNM